MAAAHWFPAKESQNVVGRVIEVEKLHAAKSRDAKKPVHIMVPVMESKITGKSDDVSHQELKDWNREDICARFPGAWEHYLKSKEGQPPSPSEIVINGTPISKADFIAKDKITWLELQGFSTVEQLAAVSDSQVQALGPGARTWVKKAKQLLAKPA